MTTLDQAQTLKAETRSLLLEVKDVIRQFLPDATLLLYGSVARGTSNADSDIDILVLTDKPVAPKRQ